MNVLVNDRHAIRKEDNIIINGEEWEIVGENDLCDSDEYVEVEYSEEENNDGQFDYTCSAISRLLEAGVKTNIHYVLGNNSIDEAIEIIKNDSLPKGVNAILFLLHKPVGLGTQKNVLKVDDPRVAEFFKCVDEFKTTFKIGFDACSIPGIVNFSKNVNMVSVDSCEGSRHSAYVTSDMKMLPCSFDNDDMKWAYDISNDTIENAWNSEQFEDFRSSFRQACPGCDKRLSCLGGCPIKNEVVLCGSENRERFATLV